MKRKRSAIGLLCLLLLLTGCGKNKGTDGAVQVYYKTPSMTGLRTAAVILSAAETQDCIGELWAELSRSDYDTDRVSAVPDGVELVRFAVEGSVLSLYFNSAYGDLAAMSELLLRAALVKTYTQLEGIDAVSFFVDEKPLLGNAYTPLGAQRSADYVDIIGRGLASERRVNQVLYFLNAEGTALVKSRREATYESAYSLERDVVRRLIRGPEDAGMQRTLPETLQVISINVKDRICYVNFDASFVTDALPIDGNMIVYSLVNSLTELGAVQKVQIMVDGNSGINFRGISLDRPLERNLDFSIEG